MKFFLTVCITASLLCSCGGKSAAWKETLTQCIASSDSTAHFFNDELSIEEVNTKLRQSYMLWTETKTQLGSDTLDLEFAKELDAFNVAFHNAESLPTEYEQCKTANATIRIRLQNLQTDINNGAGSRSGYEESVQHEKEELTKIRNHCTDIQRRFEELKANTAQFEQVMTRYSVAQ